MDRRQRRGSPAARRTQCTNNLKQIGLALHNYHDQHQVFPPGVVFPAGVDSGGQTYNLDHTGWTMLLPFLDMVGLYNEYNFEVAARSDADAGAAHNSLPMMGEGIGTANPTAIATNTGIVQRHLKIFTCPSDEPPTVSAAATDSNYYYSPGISTTNYMLAAGEAHEAIAAWAHSTQQNNTAILPLSGRTVLSQGAFGTNSSATIGAIADGMSTTILASETVNRRVDANSVPVWGVAKPHGPLSYQAPSAIATYTSGYYYGVWHHLEGGVTARPYYSNPASNHGSQDSAHVLLGDGRVTMVKQSINLDVWYSLNYIKDSFPVDDTFGD